MSELGFDVVEQSISFEREGITGEITEYSFEDQEYPCMIVEVTEGKQVPMYVMMVLQKFFNSSNSIARNRGEEFGSVPDEEKRMIALYVSDGTQTMKLGRIVGMQVPSILELFKGFRILGYIKLGDKVVELKGSKLYILMD